MDLPTSIPSPPAPHPRGAWPVVAWHAPLLVLGWATALLLAFHPMLLSGLARIPGDFGDARLNNYFLEHGWRWLLRDPLHRDFWDPPVFYPAANTFAFSDVLLSAGPFYWCWRVVGLPPDTAFQFWLLTISSLNYLTMYAFLARLLRLRSLAAALGAVLFAAGSARVAQVVHPQLHVHFYSVIAVYALARFFQNGRPSPVLWFGVFCAAAVLQLYATFYLGWFLALGLLTAAAAACSRASTRRALLAALRQRPWAVVGCGAAAAVLLAPLAWHYLRAARETGVRDWASVAVGLPPPTSWFRFDSTSWLYGRASFLQGQRGEAGLQQLGFGFITPLAAAWGLWRKRTQGTYYCLLVTALALAVLVTAVGPVTAWVVVYLCVPGGMAIRAASRVCLLLLFALAVGAASFVHERRRIGAAVALALLCVLEQGQTPLSFSKEESRRRIAQIAVRVPPGGRPFLYTPAGKSDSFGEQAFVHVDAMWAGVQAGSPTLNGYSGNVPPHYLFGIVTASKKADLDLREQELRDWCGRNGLDPASVTWIHD